MASSGSSTQLAASNSGSDPEEATRQALMDERRRKRKQSNRESARRSRARKLLQLEELKAQAEALRGKNSSMAAAVHATAQSCLTVEAENCVLRARLLELSARLQSLTDLLLCMHANQQPLMASPDMYSYY